MKKLRLITLAAAAMLKNLAFKGQFPTLVDEPILSMKEAYGKSKDNLQCCLVTASHKLWVPAKEMIDRYRDLLIEENGVLFLDVASVTLTCDGADWSLNPIGKTMEEPKGKGKAKATV